MCTLEEVIPESRSALQNRGEALCLSSQSSSRMRLTSLSDLLMLLAECKCQHMAFPKDMIENTLAEFSHMDSQVPREGMCVYSPSALGLKWRDDTSKGSMHTHRFKSVH